MKLSQADIQRAQEIGARRQAVHQENTTPRFTDDRNQENIIGAMGEVAFSNLFGVPVDEMDRYYGDGGVDFTIRCPFPMTVNVKTSLKPKYLLVKTSEIDNPVHIYVLAKFANDTIEFMGWATKARMKQCPLYKSKYGIESHSLPAGQLRPMSALVGRTIKGARL